MPTHDDLTPPLRGGGDIARRAVLLAGAAVSLIPAARAQTTPRRGGTLLVGFNNDSRTFDPLFSVQFAERQVLYLVFNTLVKYAPDFSIHPELADSWQVSEDGKRVVFKLHPGVKFHDGTPFDAAAVKWNLDRRLDPAVGSPQRTQLAPVLASVEVVDPLTVAFNLKNPYPAIFSLLGERPGFMVSPAAYEKLGKEFGAHPVGTGAFVFKDWVRGSALTVERNPEYWEKGLPYLDRVEFRDLAGAVVGTQRLLTGELDVVEDLSPQDVRVIEDKPGIDLKPIALGRWYYLQWHVNAPPFDNPKLRQAFAHAIDRKRLNDIVMRGKGTVANSPTPPGLWWHDQNIPAHEYDPAKAKALLAEAGYPNGFEIALSTPQIAAFRQLNQLIQEQLAAVGIKATLAPVAANEWYARVVDGSTNLTPDRFTQRPDPDGLLYILFHSKGYANTIKYHSERVDQLLDQARSIYDQDKRRALYAQAQRQMMEDVAVVPLFFSAEYIAMRSQVRGFEWIPDQIPRFREVWKAA